MLGKFHLSWMPVQISTNIIMVAEFLRTSSHLLKAALFVLPELTTVLLLKVMA
jgi:hypothetical protein